MVFQSVREIAKPSGNTFFRQKVRRYVYWVKFLREAKMPNKPKLEQTAVRIGTAIGRAERVARALGESARETRKELTELKKTVRGLARELEETKKRLQRALG